jgi:hypothetical protein
MEWESQQELYNANFTRCEESGSDDNLFFAHIAVGFSEKHAGWSPWGTLLDEILPEYTIGQDFVPFCDPVYCWFNQLYNEGQREIKAYRDSLREYEQLLRNHILDPRSPGALNSPEHTRMSRFDINLPILHFHDGPINTEPRLNGYHFHPFIFDTMVTDWAKTNPVRNHDPEITEGPWWDDYCKEVDLHGVSGNLLPAAVIKNTTLGGCETFGTKGVERELMLAMSRIGYSQGGPIRSDTFTYLYFHHYVTKIMKGSVSIEVDECSPGYIRRMTGKSHEHMRPETCYAMMTVRFPQWVGYGPTRYTKLGVRKGWEAPTTVNGKEAVAGTFLEFKVDAIAFDPDAAIRLLYKRMTFVLWQASETENQVISAGLYTVALVESLIKGMPHEDNENDDLEAERMHVPPLSGHMEPFSSMVILNGEHYNLNNRDQFLERPNGFYFTVGHSVHIHQDSVICSVLPYRSMRGYVGRRDIRKGDFPISTMGGPSMWAVLQRDYGQCSRFRKLMKEWNELEFPTALWGQCEDRYPLHPFLPCCQLKNHLHIMDDGTPFDELEEPPPYVVFGHKIPNGIVKAEFEKGDKILLDPDWTHFGKNVAPGTESWEIWRSSIYWTKGRGDQEWFHGMDDWPTLLTEVGDLCNTPYHMELGYDYEFCALPGSILD